MRPLLLPLTLLLALSFGNPAISARAQGNCSDGTTGIIISVSRTEISPDGSQFEICFAVEGNPAETLRYLYASGVYNGAGLYPTYEHILGSSSFPGPGYDVFADYCLGGPDLCPHFFPSIVRDPDEPPYLSFPAEPAEFVCTRYDIHDPLEHAGIELYDVYAEQGDGSPASVCPLEDQANYDEPLPVELTAFDAVADGPDVLLRWATASETNNAGFEVEHRAPSASAFEPAGFVAGHGTTVEAQTYRHRVTDLWPGTHAFRLKQIDFDGAFEYSGEVEATIELVGTHTLSAAYPNPFNPQATFAFTAAQGQHVTAALYNTLGQRVATLFEGTAEANASQQVLIDGAGLASGLYVVRVQGERFTDALRITLLK